MSIKLTTLSVLLPVIFILSSPSISFADCDSCVTIFGAEVVLKSGETIDGYVVGSNTRVNKDSDWIDILNSIPSHKTLLIYNKFHRFDTNEFFKKLYNTNLYFDESKTIIVKSSEITEIKHKENFFSGYAWMFSLKGSLFKKIFSNSPSHYINLSDAFVLISYEDEKVNAEIDETVAKYWECDKRFKARCEFIDRSKEREWDSFFSSLKDKDVFVFENPI